METLTDRLTGDNVAQSVSRLFDISPPDGGRTLPRARVAVARHSGSDMSRAGVRRACDALTDLVLRSATGLARESWRLERVAGRPPALVVNRQHSDFGLSISHSRGWIAVGLSQGTEIGLDIEMVRPMSRMNAISGFLGWPSEAIDATEFWARWTLSEAFAKQSDGSILNCADQTIMSLVASHRFGRVFGNEFISALCECVEPSLILSVVIGSESVRDLTLVELDPESTCSWQPCR